MSDNKITVGVIGATGYAGSELVRLLVNHPYVEKLLLGSRSYEDESYSSVYPNFASKCDITLSSSDIEKMAQKCDLLFLSLPHGLSSFQVTEELLQETKVIDLGADFRLKDVETYKRWYKSEHGSINLLKEAVYGLSELYRSEIRGARLVANPGCYTTCSILTAHPLLAENLIDPTSIIIDAKSGVSGAGRGEKLDSLYCEVNESLKAYGIATHRHTPEIEEQLSLSNSGGKSHTSLTLSFTPHLVPMNRGIFVTLYANLKEGVKESDIGHSYEKYYQNEPFIRLLGAHNTPQTRWVKGSNFTDIGFVVDKRVNRVIACGSLDNLVKGAAGQALQNMNIMFGFEESSGLNAVAPFPI